MTQRMTTVITAQNANIANIITTPIGGRVFNPFLKAIVHKTSESSNRFLNEKLNFVYNTGKSRFYSLGKGVTVYQS